MPDHFAESVLHIGVTAPARAPRGRGVAGHRVAASAEPIQRRGFWVSDPVETWVQCAAVLRLDDLVVMGDGLVCRSRPLATVEQLADAVARSRSRPGVQTLKRALALIRPRTDSARETALRLLMVRAGLPEPEINGQIVNRFGAVIAHGDLLYRSERVIVEYDGRQHSTPGQFSIDIARLDDLMEEGWRVIRVDSSLLARRAELIAKISRALQRIR